MTLSFIHIKMPAMLRKILFGLVGFVFLFSLSVAYAQTPTTNVLVTLAPLSRTSQVELSALTVDAAISETGGHTLAQGTLTWKAHNTDTLNPVTVTVGFPALANTNETFDPTKFSVFGVTLDNKPVILGGGSSDVVYGGVTKTVNWYTFDLQLNPDEKKIVSAEFAQDLGDGIFPRFTYGILVGNRWKNAVGSARITINLPTETTGEQFIALDPTVPDFDGKKLNWLWSNLDPEADPAVTLIRPSAWQSLLDQRAAVANKPDDANAQLALGRMYQMLASQSSPRRDNFLAQAVAALETAARLAPENPDAVKTLAQLYEQRAGSPNGPRDVNYVSLAMAQWQNLANTSAAADARRQLAEDSFYLALDAHSHGEYDRELKLLGDAQNYSPDGAGPLYTIDRLANQIKLTHIAAARDDLEADAIGNAMQHIRAVYGDSFEAEPTLPNNSVALIGWRVTTMLNERDITLSIVPYPTLSAGARDAVNQVVAALNQTSAAQVRFSEDANTYTLAFAIPFSSDADLRERLVKLAAALPTRTDWGLIRSALVPTELEFSSSEDTFTRRVNYRETIDLTAGRQAMQSVLNEMSATIGDLKSKSPDDPEAQLKIALLTHAQTWWFQELGGVELNYALDAGGNSKTWTVNPGAPETLEYTTEVIRSEWYAIGAGAGIGIILLIVLAIVLIRRHKPTEFG